jgi:septum formation protein
MFRIPRIYLASKSPRRRELLTRIGVHFDVLLLREQPGRSIDVNETPKPSETPHQYVQRVAREKAAAGWTYVQMRRLPPQPVLAADTEVCLGERIFGKPADRADAAEMLRGLSGREHMVLTSVAVQFERRALTALSESTVRFRVLEEDEIQAYVATGEPMDKAGAYAIQGIAQAFIPEILGSYSGVVGLPLHETVGLLKKIQS